MKRVFSKSGIHEVMNRFGYEPPVERVATGGKRRLFQKLVALIIIIAMLQVVGVAPVVIVCCLALGCVLVIAAWRSAKRKTEVIFNFYVSADEVLRDEERRRYRFEISDIIDAGERVVASMPDPPPLSSFALGALYSLIGDHNAVVEHLGIAAEEEVLKESSHVSPSRQLRRYVKRLRQIERAPDRYPKVYAAIKRLEHMHHLRAARMFAESQQQLKRLVEAYESQASDQRKDAPIFVERSLRSLSPPPPISELLNDIYQEEQPTS